jgi:hypothetical protein
MSITCHLTQPLMLEWGIAFCFIDAAFATSFSSISPAVLSKLALDAAGQQVWSYEGHLIVLQWAAERKVARSCEVPDLVSEVMRRSECWQLIVRVDIYYHLCRLQDHIWQLLCLLSKLTCCSGTWICSVGVVVSSLLVYCCVRRVSGQLIFRGKSSAHVRSKWFIFKSKFWYVLSLTRVSIRLCGQRLWECNINWKFGCPWEECYRTNQL